MEKEYSNLEILELLKGYFEHKFNLKENSDVMIFYNNEFYFNCVERKNMSSICKINTREILSSCNNVDSKDELFYDTEDLLEELNSMVKCENIVEYLIKYFENEYEIMCLSDEI